MGNAIIFIILNVLFIFTFTFLFLSSIYMTQEQLKNMRDRVAVLGRFL